MNEYKRRYAASGLLCAGLIGAAALGAIAPAAAQEAQPTTAQTLEARQQYAIPAGDLGKSLDQLADQNRLQIGYQPQHLAGKTAPALEGEYSLREALGILLSESGLEARFVSDNAIVVRSVADAGADAGNAPGGTGEGMAVAEAAVPNPDTDPGVNTTGERTTSSVEVGRQGGLEEIIVTAQKRAEKIQDVPIAISSFSPEDLSAMKIEGGFDLLKAIPNVTFSKSNFTGYNFSIRGVGTKAISASTDPGVAVAFNNTTLIVNRLFEQEYFDVERVEVLRGPQGTLYGRNATSGVINILSAKPKLNAFEGDLKLETGNYSAKRAVGMVNVPIVDDMLALRVAGAMTQRTGFDYNEITQNDINGRDLWSGRITLGFEPHERIRMNLMWEHFDENDNRTRTSKQLCHRDPGPEFIGNTLTNRNSGVPVNDLLVPATFSTSCRPGSLYDEAAYQAPNGLALPYIYAPLTIGSYCGPGCTVFGSIGNINGNPVSWLRLEDPYGGITQSKDLRTIASVLDPVYRAKADVFDLSIDVAVTDTLTLISQTVYNDDEVYSFQDYNRFNTFPTFTDTTQLDSGILGNAYRGMSPGGVFCDPQLGCSDKVSIFDISQSASTQFSQELRLQSDFEGPVNFSIGANYTKFKTVNDYYVFSNAFTALALSFPFYDPTVFGEIDITRCSSSGGARPFGVFDQGPVPAGDPTGNCPYVDPQAIDTSRNFEGDGHNYFRSKNPYELSSAAAFGELYVNVTDAMKVTAGLRYTQDRKDFTLVPSQLLLAPGWLAGGVVSKGYPSDGVIKQKWDEWTGRLGFDWKLDLGFTDQTLLYAFYSRGYKGGGANPPSLDFATVDEACDFFTNNGGIESIGAYCGPNGTPLLKLANVDYAPTFEPEFVNAFEVGAKNTLFDGSMILNLTGFYYDYKDYQVSQIRDRSAVNENFDATIWGLEVETIIAPTPDLKLIANVGYLRTRIGDGEESIDLMNRTQGNPDYVVVKPWVQNPSNCVVPVHVIEAYLQGKGSIFDPSQTFNPIAAGLQYCGRPGGGAGIFSGNGIFNIDPATCTDAPDPVTFQRCQKYDPLAVDANGNLLYPEINGGAGIKADLSGNELPNAPRWTANIGAEYGRDVLDGNWRVTFRGDAYWQADSFARVYNAINDELRSWYNFNFSIRINNDLLGLETEFYVKNALDKSPITDAFLNSDDSGLTTNVFTLDPRLVGLSIRKRF